MNRKKWILIAIIIVAIIIGASIFFYFQNTASNTNENTYEANRTSSTNTSNEKNQTNPSNQTNEQQEKTNNTTDNEVKQGISEAETTPPNTEEQISTFSTKIYSTDPARQNNVSITCSTLNETIVKKGETFSFCNTVRSSLFQ